MASQLDMFGLERAQPAQKPRQLKTPSAAVSHEDMVRQLEASGRYRVVRRIEPRPVVLEPKAGFPYIGLLVDTETTGLNWRTEEVIEIGAIAFTYDAGGGFGDIIGTFSALQQPSKPIPPEITELTGITDEMVAGQAIDQEALRRFIEPADLIIAHNAGFDRPFCEAMSDSFRDKDWGCSNVEIGWRARGFEGSKLGYLLQQSGLFHNGHRALDDCFALLEVLLSPKDGSTALAELLASARRTVNRIWAEHSPFDAKDKMKARGYRWSGGADGSPKAWWTEVGAEGLEAELTWLRTEVYNRADIDPPVHILTARDRYRA
jgi:DNA polymerase-3 subunit epsilon